jgi:hypothetical protein
VRSAVLVAAVLLASAPARADHDDEVKIVAAINAKDSGQVAKYVKYPVRVYDLWFEDASCRERFNDAQVDAAGVAALVACLQPLALRDLGMFWIYEPGVEVQMTTMTVDGAPTLTSIHGVRTISEQPDAPQIGSAFLEHHRTGGLTNVVLKEDPDAYVSVEVCVNVKGHVTSADVSRVEHRRYGEVVLAAAWKWTFKPFVVHGKAIPVCAAEIQRNGIPPTVHPLTPPPRVPLTVSPASLEALRQSGSRFIEPSDETKEVIADAKKKNVTGTFKVCVDDHGTVTSATPVKSTGFDDYDSTVAAAVQKWTYSPFLVNARAVPVCTAVTVSYSP